MPASVGQPTEGSATSKNVGWNMTPEIADTGVVFDVELPRETYSLKNLKTVVYENVCDSAIATLSGTCCYGTIDVHDSVAKTRRSITFSFDSKLKLVEIFEKIWHKFEAECGDSATKFLERRLRIFEKPLTLEPSPEGSILV